jgi:hypothetical protein
MALGDEPAFPTTAHPIFFDHKVIATGTYDAGPNETTYTFPFPYRPLKMVNVATGSVRDVTILTDTTCKVTGNFADKCIFGRPIEMDLYLSRPYPRNEQGLAMIDHRIVIKNITVKHSRTVAYDLFVDRAAEASFVESFRKQLGQEPYGFAEVGVQRTGVHWNSESLILAVFNSTCRPCTILGLEYEVEIVEATR